MKRESKPFLNPAHKGMTLDLPADASAILILTGTEPDTYRMEAHLPKLEDEMVASIPFHLGAVVTTLFAEGNSDLLAELDKRFMALVDDEHPA